MLIDEGRGWEFSVPSLEYAVEFTSLIYIMLSMPRIACERLGSVLKWIHTYLHASIGQKRSSVLAFINFNHGININVTQ